MISHEEVGTRDSLRHTRRLKEPWRSAQERGLKKKRGRQETRVGRRGAAASAVLDTTLEQAQAQALLERHAGKGGYLVGAYSNADTMLVPVLLRRTRHPAALVARM